MRNKDFIVKQSLFDRSLGRKVLSEGRRLPPSVKKKTSRR